MSKIPEHLIDFNKMKSYMLKKIDETKNIFELADAYRDMANTFQIFIDSYKHLFEEKD